MEQTITNKPGQQLDSKALQQTDGYQINDAQTNNLVQDAETDEDEIIEKRNITDYWSLPQKDHRTINENIKMRNR